MVEPLRIEVTAVGGAVEVHLHGEVDLAAEHRVVGLLSDLCVHRQPVVIDMGGVTFVDSTGVRALMICHQACLDAGTELSLRGVTPAVRRVLELSGVDVLLRTHD